MMMMMMMIDYLRQLGAPYIQAANWVHATGTAHYRFLLPLQWN